MCVFVFVFVSVCCLYLWMWVLGTNVGDEAWVGQPKPNVREQNTKAGRFLLLVCVTKSQGYHLWLWHLLRLAHARLLFSVSQCGGRRKGLRQQHTMKQKQNVRSTRASPRLSSNPVSQRAASAAFNVNSASAAFSVNSSLFQMRMALYSLWLLTGQ